MARNQYANPWQAKLPEVRQLPASMINDARLAVAARAQDADDAGLLLDMLGIGFTSSVEPDTI